jgi:hypothetical protein
MSVTRVVLFASKCVVHHCIVTAKFCSITVTIPCASTGNTLVTEIKMMAFIAIEQAQGAQFNRTKSMTQT